MRYLNGDHLPDRFIREILTGSGTDAATVAQWTIFFNTGAGWTTVHTWQDPYEGPYAGTADLYQGFVDFNGDGLVDRVVGDPAAGGFWVYGNTGAKFRSQPDFWADPLAVGSPDHPAVGRLFSYDDNKLYVAIRDLNGDALPDRLFRIMLHEQTPSGFDTNHPAFFVGMNLGGQQWAQPDLGNGAQCLNNDTCVLLNATTTPGLLDPATGDLDGYLETDRTALIDMNQDGYLDRVVGHSESGGFFSVYLYQGVSPHRHRRSAPAAWTTTPTETWNFLNCLLAHFVRYCSQSGHRRWIAR